MHVTLPNNSSATLYRFPRCFSWLRADWHLAQIWLGGVKPFISKAMVPTHADTSFLASICHKWSIQREVKLFRHFAKYTKVNGILWKNRKANTPTKIATRQQNRQHLSLWSEDSFFFQNVQTYSITVQKSCGVWTLSCNYLLDNFAIDDVSLLCRCKARMMKPNVIFKETRTGSALKANWLENLR